MTRKPKPVLEHVDTGTSAPHQTYPGIVEAPQATDVEWQPDDRPGAAPDQTYPTVEPAPPVVEPDSVETRLTRVEQALLKAKLL